MTKKLSFNLVLPERALCTDLVHMVVVPGTEGDFAVLSGHAPLMSSVRTGAVAIYKESAQEEPDRIFLDGGFAEVTGEGLTILAEYAVLVKDLDVQHVSKELAQAQESLRLTKSKDSAQYLFLERQIQRFQAMIDVLSA